MTPGARIAAAAECLDPILDGQPAEKVLTAWARGHRFAGSKDRAAIRDLVFDAVRNLRVYAAIGGRSGRGIVVAQAAQTGRLQDFDGSTHALPAPEPEAYAGSPSDADQWNLPDWLIPRFEQSLGEKALPVAQVLGQRAPVFLRVNSARASADKALLSLAEDGVEARLHPDVAGALEVTSGARAILRSAAYLSGLVELQDAASQAICLAVPLEPGQRVLDYCAGGGGKALALAARMSVDVDVHDANPGRMADIESRAQRAGVTLLSRVKPPYDVVVCDVPCSGSGTWRRAPDAKWKFTLESFQNILKTQEEILEGVMGLVAPGGLIAYMTCSVLAEENQQQTAAFLKRHPEWRSVLRQQHLPGSAGDGLFVEVLRHT